MIDDPGERWNRVSDPDCAQTVADHRARIERFFDRYADPRWDLWQDGGTKSRSTELTPTAGIVRPLRCQLYQER